MKRLLRFPFHSLLIGAYFIAHLYARNIAYIPFQETYRSIAIYLGFSFLLLSGFRLILKEWDRAGLVCSLIVVLFFSFGHVANALTEWTTGSHPPFRVSVLGWVWLSAFLILSLMGVRAKWANVATGPLNLMSVMLMVFPLMTIVPTAFWRSSPSEGDIQTLASLRGETSAEAGVPLGPRPEWPDIYYIVFDGYERADVLKELYGYDNSEFIEALRRRGFYVADLSRSNYLSTNYSLSTSLNLVYFQDFPPRILRNARYDLRTNYVTDFLRKRGYQVVVFDSGTGNTTTQYYDEFVAPPKSPSAQGSVVNPFERLLVQTTLGLLLTKGSGESAGPALQNHAIAAAVNQELETRRERVRHALARLPDSSTLPGPYFLFAHIYLPHIPFLYGPEGEPLQFSGDMNFYWYEVEQEDYPQNYVYQIEYLNRSVLQTIDRIQDSSEKPVVIILQSDHGDELLLDWDNPTAVGVGARSAILNAIYYSDGSYEELYPTLTPVNTFRAVFNHWFGTGYPWLQDKVFFHEHPLSTSYSSQPEFFDSCSLVSLCLPNHAE